MNIVEIYLIENSYIISVDLKKLIDDALFGLKRIILILYEQDEYQLHLRIRIHMI